MADFSKTACFPRVTGEIDGRLIPIRALYSDKHLYVSHEGFNAINVMAVSNTQLSFTNFISS